VLLISLQRANSNYIFGTHIQVIIIIIIKFITIPIIFFIILIALGIQFPRAEKLSKAN